MTAFFPFQDSMRFNNILDWSEHYKTRLESKLVRVPGRSCKVWNGGTGRYGQMKVYVPVDANDIEGAWTQRNLGVHRVTYMVNGPMFSIEPASYDVSHLCHEPRCCELTHLSLEPHSVNIQRATCRDQGRCTRHGQFPKCLLPGLR